MDAYLTGLEQARDGRRRPVARSARSRRSSSPGWTPRSTSGWTSSAPTRPRRVRGKAGIANARLAYEAYEEMFAGDRWHALAARRRAPAAPAVGLHRRQGPGLPRHHVRHRAGRAEHGEHDARGDPERVRRPRRDRAATPPTPATTRPRAVFADLAALGIELDEVTELLEVEGVQKFMDSWSMLLEGVQEQLEPGRQEGRPSDAISPSPRPAAAVELGYADARPADRGRSSSSSPTGSPAGSPRRTRRCGVRTPSPRRPSGCPGSTLAETSRPLVAEIEALRDRAARPRASTTSCWPAWAAARWRPRSSAATAGVELVTLDTTDAGQVAAALAERPGPHRAGRVEQVRRHGRDRLAPACLREGLHRRGHRPQAADRRGHRPGLAAAADGRGGRLPQGVPGRPERRRPVQRADRVRPGAVRAGRRRHRRAARRGRRGLAGAGQRRPATTRACGSARCSGWPTTPARTRSCSPTSAPASSASATGPSS